MSLTNVAAVFFGAGAGIGGGGGAGAGASSLGSGGGGGASFSAGSSFFGAAAASGATFGAGTGSCTTTTCDRPPPNKNQPVAMHTTTSPSTPITLTASEKSA